LFKSGFYPIRHFKTGAKLLINIFCIEQNYFGQKREQRIEIPGEPVIFVKPQSALFQTGTPFSYPRFVNELYCGCELVLRISENGKDIQEKLAGNYYDSISVGVNFTALDNRGELREEELSWEKAKAWENSSVTGMWMPATNFKNKKDINFCLYKNRELLQLGNSGLMINNFDTIISAISKSFPVNIGDLIFTGTPAGIGKLVAGDKLEAFIEDDSLLEFDIK
jgi:2-keto-4-pentenoate hydratase/2-oxohepta-3-ene-1,7-dioic acid hydratase in catechol pathway